MQNLFSLTTAQAAAILACKPHVLINKLRRHRHADGIVPRKQPNGRLLWPRDAVLAAAGVADIDCESVDLSDSLSFFEARGLPVDDPFVKATAKALSGSYAGTGYEVHAADDAHSFSVWAEALSRRVTTVAKRLPPAERRQTLDKVERASAQLALMRLALSAEGI